MDIQKRLHYLHIEFTILITLSLIIGIVLDSLSQLSGSSHLSPLIRLSGHGMIYASIVLLIISQMVRTCLSLYSFFQKKDVLCLVASIIVVLNLLISLML